MTFVDTDVIRADVDRLVQSTKTMYGTAPGQGLLSSTLRDELTQDGFTIAAAMIPVSVSIPLDDWQAFVQKYGTMTPTRARPRHHARQR